MISSDMNGPSVSADYGGLSRMAGLAVQPICNFRATAPLLPRSTLVPNFRERYLPQE